LQSCGWYELVSLEARDLTEADQQSSKAVLTDTSVWYSTPRLLVRVLLLTTLLTFLPPPHAHPTPFRPHSLFTPLTIAARLFPHWTFAVQVLRPSLPYVLPDLDVVAPGPTSAVPLH
jgi:hypothetical protein